MIVHHDEAPPRERLAPSAVSLILVHIKLRFAEEREKQRLELVAKKKAEEEKKKHAVKRRADEALPVCLKGCFS